MKVTLYKENNKFMITYYYLQNTKKKFIKTVIDQNKGSNQRQNLARIIKELRLSKFSYYTGSSNSETRTIGDLIILLEKSSTDYLKNIFIYENKDYLDCYGSIVKTSENFFFRVYDENIIKRIKTAYNRNRKLLNID